MEVSNDSLFSEKIQKKIVPTNPRTKTKVNKLIYYIYRLYNKV